MKVFIWEDVLRDWSSGLAIAYAKTLKEALAQFEDCIAEELGTPTNVIDCSTDERPYGTYVYGGS